jgi:5-formyltetrahydrofolate cyclo-ligase
LEQKNVICLGKIEGQRMVMHRIRSLEEIGRNPVTNILEPQMTSPVDESKISIAIVPGRAFTRDGLRMGRGNGGYDRWISEQSIRAPGMKSVGICFNCQLVDTLPTEAHDKPVDSVITAQFSGERNRPQN